ncbi:hypothetical protein [Desulfonatronovibrio hydrogenovorans]|uniref:hypothetical protein n=1 Tax=Desulfonatronovibrio hydrogenovorans TaxID=53245 RepID=UPI001237244A|nr:hypothetical protein [Desulfonatronovibrio hydrogenovorans]
MRKIKFENKLLTPDTRFQVLSLCLYGLKTKCKGFLSKKWSKVKIFLLYRFLNLWGGLRAKRGRGREKRKKSGIASADSGPGNDIMLRLPQGELGGLLGGLQANQYGKFFVGQLSDFFRQLIVSLPVGFNCKGIH